jgi:ribonuclease P protein subunit RPR2
VKIQENANERPLYRRSKGIRCLEFFVVVRTARLNPVFGVNLVSKLSSRSHHSCHQIFYLTAIRPLVEIMAKIKEPKGSLKVTNPAMHSRVSYLYQAAAYLEFRKHDSGVLVASSAESPLKASSSALTSSSEGESIDHPRNALIPSSHALSRKLLTDLRAVSLKAQLRLSPAMKNCICKKCNIMLVEGSTSATVIENKSKDGKKPWADVLVRKCISCGLEKRFPVGMESQPRRPKRQAKAVITKKD